MLARLLLLAYHFPPEDSSCTEKNTRLLKALVEAGHDVTVVTKNKGYSNVVMHGDRAINVLRTTNGILHNEKHNTLGFSEIGIPKTTGLRNRLVSLAKSLKRRASLSIIPDAAIDWIGIAEREVIESNVLYDTDLIISTSSPYSSHILAYRLSKKTGVKYMLTYGDPWVYEPKRKRGLLRYTIERCVERRVVQNAAYVFVITTYNKKKYEELYDIDDSKIGTFNIGSELVTDKDLKCGCAHSRIALLYGGSLDPVHRNPEPMFEAISSLDNVTVDIYNEDYPNLYEMVSNYGVSDVVTIHKLVPSNQFAELMKQYDYLVLFGNKTPFQVPGKVFSYIASGKHILYIKNNDDPDDGTEEILLQYGNCTVVQNKASSIIEGIELLTKDPCRIASVDRINEFCYLNTMRSIVDAVKIICNS